MPVRKQRDGTGSGRGLRPAALLVFLILALPAAGQSVRVEPSVNARLTYTDNARVGSGRGEDFVAEVTPAVGISRDGGRVSGRMNARVRNIQYANNSQRSNSFLTLDGRGQFEAIEDFLFVDADAAIRRNTLSLFGDRWGDEILGESRRSESRTFSIAPRAQFRLGSFADGQIGYRVRWLDSERSVVSGSRLSQWNASLGDPTLGRLGWGVNYVRTDTSYGSSAIRDVTQETARATLFYNVSPQFRLRGTVGRESNDFGGPRKESGDIVGGGFDWFPTPRTAISGTVEDRLFGTGYDASVTHRRARSSWSLSYGKDFSSSLQRFGSVFSDPLFATLFDDPNFLPDIDDPVLREDIIRQFLGLSGDTFISNAYYVDERLRGSVSLIGVRNTVTFAVSSSDRTRSSSIDGLRSGDEFLDSRTVRSRSASVSLSHRLSGISSLNASLTRATAERSGGVSQETRRFIASLGYSTRLGPKTNAGLTYRHQRVSRAGGGSDFTENVLTANIGMRF